MHERTELAKVSVQVRQVIVVEGRNRTPFPIIRLRVSTNFLAWALSLSLA